MKYFLLLSLMIFYAEISFAQGGKIDSSFGINGKLTIHIGDSDDRGSSIGLQSDGKIILAGEYLKDSLWNLVVLRLNENGDTDSSFGINGKATLRMNLREFSPVSSAIRQNDKIVVGGNCTDYSYNMIQLNANGSLDSSFGNHGIITVAKDSGLIGNDLALQLDGKILVGGYQFAAYGYGYNFAIERFDSNGVIDKTFGTNGRTLTDGGDYWDSGESIAIDNDSAIFLAGSKVLKYRIDGRLDSTFGINGMTAVDSSHGGFAYCIASQADHKILVSGLDASEDLLLARYNTDGTVDSSFGLNGYAEDYDYGVAFSIVTEPDAKIISGGFQTDYDGYDSYFLITKWNADGTLDTNFSPYGHIFTDFGFQDQYISKIIFQPDGKILAAGTANNGANYDFALARYTNNDIVTGVIDIFAKKDSVFIYPNPIHQTETLQYSLGKDETLSINLYDVSGRLVQTFFNNQKRIAGKHQEELKFNQSLPAGNYVLAISNGKNKMSIKIIKG